MHQMNPTLQTIYNKHYIKNPKDFVELIELIGEKSLENVLATIKKQIFKAPVKTPAMVDRLTHKSYIVNMNGNSYRSKK